MLYFSLTTLHHSTAFVVFITMLDVTESIGNVTENSKHSEGRSVLQVDSFMNILYIIVSVVGVVGNGIVVFTMLHSRALRRKPSNVLVINQSTIDLCSSILIAPSYLLNTTVNMDHSLASSLWCKLWLARPIKWGCIHASSYGLVCLSFERFLALVYPFFHTKHMTTRVARLMCIIPWVISFSYSVPLKVPTSYVDETGTCKMMAKWPSQKMQERTMIAIIFLQYFLPCISLIYLYLRMYLAIRRAKNSSKTGNEDNKRALKMEQAERNMFKTFVLVTLAFFLCVSWNQWYFFLGNINLIELDWQTPWYHFTVIAIYTNAIINPFIYSFSYEPFKKEIVKICGCRRKPKYESYESSQSVATKF
ncbi:unnamed protein product [Dimorphilus gyrociliatus]|uniref:G-protein coupled receptors family 1 profile domain-containing protein n=1 Tax=Dimorphilus gyrociliatus TaxID=2664684 RepID=A0A7I8VDW9_9ANNE|nr:unnamed protein product [Dimorphilus gyrociliatus]